MTWRNFWRNLIYFGSLLLFSLFGIVFNTPASLFVTDVALALMGLSLLSLVWPLRRLHIQTSQQQWRAHQTTPPIRLTLRGRLFSPHLTLQAGHSTWRMVYFGRPLTFDWPQDLPRGRYLKLPMIVTTGDFLNLARKSKRLTLNQPLVIGPQCEHDFAVDIQAHLTQLLKVMAAETALDSMNLQSLRTYRAGDPINMIDWKITAKEDNLMIRHNEPEKQAQWQGVFLGTPDAATASTSQADFECRLGVFYELATEAKLWQQTHYLTETVVVQPTWDQLAMMQPNMHALDQLIELQHDLNQPLIVFGGPALTYQELQSQLSSTTLIYVQITTQTAEINSSRQHLAVQRRSSNA